MSRPQKNRRITDPPKMLGFKPFGMESCEMVSVMLQYDEFQCLKLVNYDHLSQEEASELMGVSRPTLTRIYNKALEKIATAFVEGRPVRIEGGNIEFDKEWYKCKRCFRLFEGRESHTRCEGCTRYGKDELIRLS
jgi:predicted DNA-binding protein (UPF0251 family)